jgi:hypothetical protein
MISQPAVCNDRRDVGWNNMKENPKVKKLWFSGQEVFNDKYNTYMKENVRRRESVDVLSITSYLMDARVSKRISYIGTYIVYL